MSPVVAVEGEGPYPWLLVHRLLVVEDDPDIRTMVRRYLEAEGYEVLLAADAREAGAALASAPDLVLLDVGLPDEDGRDFLSHLRRTSDVPVILLTGQSAEADRVLGLKLGADDYVVKPFFPDELVARIESVLRRSKRPAPAAPSPAAAGLDFDGLSMDAASREVRVGGEIVDLTAKEFDLLCFLASSPRQVFSREQLLANVWSSSSDWQDDATVTEHVRRIRRRIEKDPNRPRWIVTVRGAGYRFEP